MTAEDADELDASSDSAADISALEREVQLLMRYGTGSRASLGVTRSSTQLQD